MPAQRKVCPKGTVAKGRKFEGLLHRAILLLRRGKVHPFPPRFWLAAAMLLAAPTLTLAQQTSNGARRITAAVDNSLRVTIPQSKHPLAQPAFEAGPLDGTTPMQRMILVLGVSPEQGHDLTTFLDSQQTQGSPDYHNWLTPDQFGQRFGPAPQDIQVVTRWLQQQGFTVGSVARSGRWIEFSGTSAQVEAAFQTQMRHYVVNGEAHVANATNISIPAALAPVVRGVASLHNFFSKPMHVQGAFVRRTTDGTYAPLSGEANFSTGHALSPADFAKIYDVPNLLLSPAPGTVLNGTGETIAIVARTDIDLQDVADFRTVTGLPAVTSSNPNFIINGEDPGILSADDQVETTLDTEWSGAVAPAATIDVVISQPTLVEDGLDLSSMYIVDHNLAPIMSVSFGGCEALFGSGPGSNSDFFNGLWQQASAQGISVFVASGDDGAAGCDPNSPVFAPGASGGVGVNALSSSWYDTAVGGTEFNESITSANFWNPVNLTDLQSVIGYIPERVWNDSCSTGCEGGLDSLEAGGGGVSLLYPTPPYQTLNVSGLQAALSPFAVSGVTPRGVPDVSLTASANHDGYLLCLNLSCEPTSNPGFVQVGGTSVSSPAFAGIMALVDQKLANKPQGLANYVLYPLAAAETYSSCNSSSRTNPATPTTCVFNDNTVGNNGVPGNDVTNDPTTGALGYPTGTGFDLASGLGSVDANNLINAWSVATAAFFGTQTTITSPASINITHGATVAITGTTARLSTDGTTLTPTGTIALLAQGGPFPNPIGVGSATLSGSGGTATVSGDISDLPGGSYTLFANYPGDGTFAGSASTAINVTVAKEPSGVGLLDSPAGAGTLSNAPITVSYGTPIVFEAFISGLASAINQTGDGAATGTVTFTRTLGSTTTNFSPAVPLVDYAQADSGLGEFYDCSGTPSSCLTPGVNIVNGNYSGDNSFTAGNSGTSNPSFSLSVTIVSAATSTTVSSPSGGATVGTGTPVTLNAAVATSSGSGNAPNGTVTFFSGATQLAGPVAVTGTAGNQTFAGAGTSASAVASLTTPLPAGANSITAIYNGDSNYAASPASAPITITAVGLPATTTTLSASPNPSTLGQNVALTATVTSTQTSPAITGTVTFSVATLIIGTAPVSGGQAIFMNSGSPVGTFTITATYSGDTNYNGSSGTTIFTANNPAPTLTGISPTSGSLGVAVPSLVLTGSGFLSSSTVNFGSNQITGGTVGSGGTTLTVPVPASDLATAGPVSVTVTNPAPGGGTSGPQTFTVNNPLPSISTLSPTSATAGGATFALTITGTGFAPGATVTFGAFGSIAPTSGSPTQIVVQIPATDFVTAGNINVVVVNPAPGGGASSGSPFTINNPLPSISTLSPTSATAGGATFPLTITGTGFAPGATVTFGTFGSIAPTSGSPTQIVVQIPAADFVTAGNINVVVVNPAPGGGASSGSPFTINNPLPSISALSPTSATAGGATFPLTITGTGFAPGATVTFGAFGSIAPTSGSPTQIVVQIPATDIATGGNVNVTATNVSPGGGTSTATVFPVNNAVPTITQLSSTSATAGGAAFALTITGTGFAPGATVTFGTFGSIAPTSGSPTQIVVQIPAADFVTAGNINVVVANPAPGGGASSGSPFTINNPLPSISTLSPTNATAGGATFPLTITGTGFAPGATVTFGTFGSIAPTSGSPTQIVVQIPATDFATAGNISVVVVNPAPGGGASSGSPFTINNPLPSISTLSPTSATAGGATFPLTITGTGFAPGATVTFGTFGSIAPTSGSPTQIVVQIPAADFVTAGNINVVVVNPAPGGGTSTAKVFAINNAVPTIGALSPTSATAGGATFALTITGTGFAAGATVNFGTFTGLIPTSIASGQVVVQIPATDFATSGSINVVVANPAPGGGASSASPFTINNPLPSISTLSPTSATAGGATFPLTITGTGFAPGATVTFGAFGSIAPTSGSPTQIVVQIPATDFATAGNISVVVVNPAPGGGASSASPFTINNPLPSISTLSPTSATAGGAAFALTITGTGFAPGATVTFGAFGSIAPTSGSPTQIVVQIPAADFVTAGNINVVVVNPAPGGGASSGSPFTINNPLPSISTLSPTSATAGGATFALTISGTGFAAGATVSFGTFTGLVPTSITPGQIVVPIPATDVATSGSINVVVANPAPGGGASSGSPFTINNPLPSISTLSPTSATAGGATFALTISGTGFAAGATVSFGTFTGLVPASITATTITVQIPAADIAAGGNVNVTVTNVSPGGGTSTAKAFPINNPLPSISTLSPTSATAGGPTFALTISGTGFAAGATVSFGTFTGLVPASITATTITVQIPAADIAAGGNVTVTVTNVSPGGGTSTAKAFPVNNAVPTISGLNPTGVIVNSGTFALTITGTGFAPGATVSFGTFTGLVPTSIAAGQIVVQIPAGDIGTVGSINISVTNSTPGGGASTGFSFSIASAPNPAPALASINPTSGTTGQSVNLTLAGTNFIAGSIVTFGANQDSGASLGTGGNTLTITIPASQLSTAGPVSVTVVNPAPGGGTSLAQTFTVNNPSPTLTAISPTSGSLGQAIPSFVLTGTGFVAGSTVKFGSNNITGGTVGSGGTTLTVSVPAPDLATAGPVSVAVTNAAPGGGTSSPETFTVDNSTPTITLLSPATAAAGGAAFTLTITGTNFVPGATASFGTFTGLVPASITATTITVQIPATDIASGGTINVSVSTPAPGGGASGTLPFTINNPMPTVTSLSPTNALAGGAAFQLTITGTGFVSGVSGVTFGSNAAIIPSPASVTPTQIQLQIPATYIASAGNINVTVTNPAPNGGTSTTSANSAFAIKNAIPTLASISPTSGTLGQPVSSLVLTGSGFLSGSTVNFGSNQITGGTVGSGGTTLTVPVPASDAATAGPVSVTVTNPAPGGGTSGSQTFTVNNPLPTIANLSQSSATAGGAAFPLTITGTNFVTGATVTFGSFGSLTPTSLATTQIVVTIPAPDIATVTSINVTVTNPAPGGGISNAEPFTIESTVLAVTSISPTTATAGGAAFALTINGSGFLPGATVNFGSITGLVPTSITAGQVVVQIPATDIATGATMNVSVVDPAPATGVSNSEPFAINNPVPTIASVSPTHAPGGAGFTMTITGTGFMTGATVALGPNPSLTPTTISPTQIVVSVPASDMTAAGTPKVAVTNPAPGGGASTQPLTFTVDDFTATISANPTTITAGQSTTITVTVAPTNANGFGNAVNFTVSGLPEDSTISPNPIPAVTTGNDPVTFMLTLNTTARSALPSAPSRPAQPLGIQLILWGMTAVLAMMALAALARGQQTHRWRTAVPSAVLFAALAVVSGCTTKTNSEVTGTPAGPAQISVIAKSGTLVHTSQTVTITVN